MESNKTAFVIPDENVGGPAVTLSRFISAIQLVRQNDGTAKLGLLTQLSPGTQIIPCGDGFNAKTIKVSVRGQWFFVFAQDVEPLVFAAAN